MRIFRRILLLLLAIIIVLGSVVCIYGYTNYLKVVEEKPLAEAINEIRQDEDYLKINTLPADYTNAVIAVEDHRFKEHGTLDLYGIGRAIVSNIKQQEFAEGGSTITQQVAKQIYFITEKDFIKRKLGEFFVGNDLEKNYSKDEILELYCNTIYFGDGYYGVKEASSGYLQKEPKDMNLSESAMLAGIPNAPSAYAPTKNRNLTVSRQNKVLKDMVKHNYISQDQADEAMMK